MTEKHGQGIHPARSWCAAHLAKDRTSQQCSRLRSTGFNATLCGCGSSSCSKMAPWLEPKTKTCNLPELFNFEPQLIDISNLNSCNLGCSEAPLEGKSLMGHHKICFQTAGRVGMAQAQLGTCRDKDTPKSVQAQAVESNQRLATQQCHMQKHGNGC